MSSLTILAAGHRATYFFEAPFSERVFNFCNIQELCVALRLGQAQLSALQLKQLLGVYPYPKVEVYPMSRYFIFFLLIKPAAHSLSKRRTDSLVVL